MGFKYRTSCVTCSFLGALILNSWGTLVPGGNTLDGGVLPTRTKKPPVLMKFRPMIKSLPSLDQGCAPQILAVCLGSRPEAPWIQRKRGQGRKS